MVNAESPGLWVGECNANHVDLKAGEARVGDHGFAEPLRRPCRQAYRSQRDPGEGTSVAALRSEVINGRRRLRSAGESVQVNDLGEFRIAGLPAGRYYLRTKPYSGWDRRHVAEYYPGALDLKEAGVIQIKAGEERGVDIQLTRRAGVSVARQVLMPPGCESAREARVALESDTPVGRLSFFRGVQGCNGGFVFSHVSPGGYVLKVGVGNIRRTGDLAAEPPPSLLSRRRLLARYNEMKS
jgi:hypothetical protein